MVQASSLSDEQKSRLAIGHLTGRELPLSISQILWFQEVDFIHR